MYWLYEGFMPNLHKKFRRYVLWEIRSLGGTFFQVFSIRGQYGTFVLVLPADALRIERDFEVRHTELFIIKTIIVDRLEYTVSCSIFKTVYICTNICKEK